VGKPGHAEGFGSAQQLASDLHGLLHSIFLSLCFGTILSNLTARRRLCPADIRVISRMCSTISTTESSVQRDHESGTVCQHTSDSWTYRTALLDSFWRRLFQQWDRSSTFSFLLSCLLTYRADRGWTGKS